ncbi:30S ribosomal protein S13 [Candidatus Pacearchaeota archaeon]|nr:30S ribosomal protein S13 [Candidatus Pacearchaeota archaeon]
MKQETGQLQVKKQDKAEKPEKYERKEESHEMLIRILSTDIPGSRKVNIGLTYIKGISFSMSNAVCYILKMDKNKKIGELSKEEIERITAEIKNPKVPDYFKNRRNDFDTGETRHLVTTELDLKKEFDIKRMKKIHSYKGVRHSRGLPVRGQRTKSHFRKKGKNRVVGVSKKPTGKKG